LLHRRGRQDGQGATDGLGEALTGISCPGRGDHVRSCAVARGHRAILRCPRELRMITWWPLPCALTPQDREVSLEYSLVAMPRPDVGVHARAARHGAAAKGGHPGVRKPCSAVPFARSSRLPLLDRDVPRAAWTGIARSRRVG